MESRSNKGYDDLTSLFLPDILHQSPPANVVKSEPIEDNNIPLQTPNADSQANFTTFLNNNDFIASKENYSGVVNLEDASMNQSHINSNTNPNANTNTNTELANINLNPASIGVPGPFLDEHTNFFNSNHYSQFVPLEATFFPHHHHNHNRIMPSQLLSGSNHGNPWFGNGSGSPPLELDKSILDRNTFGLGYPDLRHGGYPINYSDFDQTALSQQLSTRDHEGNSTSGEDIQRQKRPAPSQKAKPKNLKSPCSSITVDYDKKTLCRLLDFNSKKLNHDCRLLDKDNNEIDLNFKGFLNGRFITNDFDNGIYILSKLERDKTDNEIIALKKKKIKTKPKVISCYRRNYIQIALNFNLTGFKSNIDNNESKILKLETTEFGYTITRVIKWFKIEITANSNISKNQNVPLIISEELKDKDKRDKDGSSTKYYINPYPINSHEQVITLNNSQIINSEIDNYFAVKRLQFKNATPNNGNSTFQNYYHLKVKLSAIVADLYYDDYIDDEFSVTNPDNSRNEVALFELESEPIIVRGRNPSFYAERNDLLVKGKLAHDRRSYKTTSESDDDDQLIIDEQKAETEPSEFPSDNVSKDDNNGGDNDDIEVDEGDEEDEADAEEADAEEDDQSDDDQSYDKNTLTDNKARSQSNTPGPVTNGGNNKTLSPLVYNASTEKSRQRSKEIINNNEKYKYFPISNVYYLPPINVVYFPHGAHQLTGKLTQDKTPIDIEQINRSKNSSVYFK